MKTVRIAVIGALLATLSTGTFAAETAKEASNEASIPFINLKRSIHSWQADGKEGLWIQDVRKQWYYAKLLAPCQGLDFAISLGFQTRTLNSLDKFSTIIVPDWDRCQIISLIKSDPPPDEKKSRKVETESR